MQTPKIDTSVHKPSKTFPRLRAATMPIASPTNVPNIIDNTPILNELINHAVNIGLIGAPL